MGGMMELDRHFNHDIVIARYGPSDEPVEYAVECETCFEVIVWEAAQAAPRGSGIHQAKPYYVTKNKCPTLNV